MRLAGELAAGVCGFVAAEGTFGFWPPRDFRFAVSLGARDAGACRALREFLQVGTIHVYDRRRPHYDDEVTFQVRSLVDLVEVVVPFMDEHLPPSYKRDQYVEWRTALLDYDAVRPRRHGR